MNDSNNAPADGAPSSGFATGSIALLVTTFVVCLNSVALLFLVCSLFMLREWRPEWEVEVSPLDFLWGIGLAIVAVRLRFFHVAYLKFLQGGEVKKFQAEQAKLWNTIGCLCAILLAYEFVYKIWLVWDLWSTPSFIPGADSWATGRLG